MNEWIIRVIVKDAKKEYTIEAIDYTKERMKEIFEEIHPKWDIKEILLVEDIEEKQAV
jgi:hypothetical protein